MYCPGLVLRRKVKSCRIMKILGGDDEIQILGVERILSTDLSDRKRAQFVRKKRLTEDEEEFFGLEVAGVFPTVALHSLFYTLLPQPQMF